MLQRGYNAVFDFFQCRLYVQGLGNGQIRDLNRAHLAFQLYAKKDSRIEEIFMTLLCDKSIPTRNVNGARFGSNLEKPASSYRLFSQFHTHTDVV